MQQHIEASIPWSTVAQKIKESIQRPWEDIHHELRTFLHGYLNMTEKRSEPGGLGAHLFVVDALIESSILDTDLEDCLVRLAQTHLSLAPTTPSLDVGLAGTAWTALHFVDDEALFASYEERLIARLNAVDDSRRPLDFVSGAAGAAAYAIERAEKGHSRTLIQIFIRSFAARSHQGPFGYLPYGDLSGNKLSSPLDLSILRTDLAHGISGIMVVLARIHRHSPKAEIGDFIQSIQEALKRIDPQCHPESTASPPPNPTLLPRWCAGPLAVGLCEVNTGILTQNHELETRGLQRCLATAKQRQRNQPAPERIGIQSGELCHGSMGNALVYARLYQRSQNTTFLDEAIYWSKLGLEQHWSQHSISGFPTYRHHQALAFVPSLLASEGGLLVLIALLSGQDPYWDRCLLISP